MVDQLSETDVHNYLLNDFNPIYADLVALLGEKPVDVVLQIEAAFVHLAVASSNGDIAVDNYNKALSHLQRAALDVVKLLWLHKKKELSYVIEDRDIRSFCVNTSESEFLEQYSRAEKLAQEARRVEISAVGVNPGASVEAYYEAAIAFDNALQLVDYGKVKKFKQYRWRYILRKHVVGFVYGVVAGVVATYIYQYL
jgi:hypothetical protein